MRKQTVSRKLPTAFYSQSISIQHAPYHFHTCVLYKNSTFAEDLPVVRITITGLCVCMRNAFCVAVIYTHACRPDKHERSWGMTTLLLQNSFVSEDHIKNPINCWRMYVSRLNANVMVRAATFATNALSLWGRTIFIVGWNPVLQFKIAQ